jgi:hypothetical protein
MSERKPEEISGAGGNAEVLWGAEASVPHPLSHRASADTPITPALLFLARKLLIKMSSFYWQYC